MDKDSPLVCKITGSIITLEKKHKWVMELNTQTGMVNSWKVTVKFFYNIYILIQLKVGNSLFLVGSVIIVAIIISKYLSQLHGWGLDVAKNNETYLSDILWEGSKQ